MPTGVFVLGYLVVWSVFSIAATAAQWGLHVAAVRGDAEVALALAEAGLIAILYTPVPQARLSLLEQLRGAGIPWLELEPSHDSYNFV